MPDADEFICQVRDTCIAEVICFIPCTSGKNFKNVGEISLVLMRKIKAMVYLHSNNKHKNNTDNKTSGVMVSIMTVGDANCDDANNSDDEAVDVTITITENITFTITIRNNSNKIIHTQIKT